jgi:hypothetical protein
LFVYIYNFFFRIGSREGYWKCVVESGAEAVVRMQDEGIVADDSPTIPLSIPATIVAGIDRGLVGESSATPRSFEGKEY